MYRMHIILGKNYYKEVTAILSDTGTVYGHMQSRKKSCVYWLGHIHVHRTFTLLFCPPGLNF